MLVTFYHLGWISPISFDPAAALPAKRQLNPMSLRCHPNAELWHKETSSPAISAATGSISGATHSPIRKTWGHLPFVSAWFVCIPFPFPLALFGLLPIRLLTDSGCSMLWRSGERGSWWARLNLTAQQIPTSTYLTISAKASQKIFAFFHMQHAKLFKGMWNAFNTKEFPPWGGGLFEVCYAVLLSIFLIWGQCRHFTALGSELLRRLAHKCLIFKGSPLPSSSSR